jgi:hypothetical protein
MNVEIGAEAALFREMEYIKGIFVAVHDQIPVVFFTTHHRASPKKDKKLTRKSLHQSSSSILSHAANQIQAENCPANENQGCSSS